MDEGESYIYGMHRERLKLRHSDQLIGCFGGAHGVRADCLRPQWAILNKSLEFSEDNLHDS